MYEVLWYTFAAKDSIRIAGQRVEEKLGSVTYASLSATHQSHVMLRHHR